MCSFFFLPRSISRTASLDSAFLQRRAPLRIIETQKSPWNCLDHEKIVFSAFPHPNKCFVPATCFSTAPRWTASLASAPRRQLILDSSSRDDVRAERAAIALSVSLSWSPDRFTKQTRGRPSWQQLWEHALQEHTSTIMSFRMVSACSALPGGDQEKPSTGRSHTSSSPTPRLPMPRKPPQPLHSLKTSPASARQSAARSTSTPSLATGSSTCCGRQRRWSMQRCLGEVQRLCPGMFDGVNHSAPYRWKRSAPRAAPLGRRTLLSSADMTRSEAWCSNGSTQRDSTPVPARDGSSNFCVACAFSFKKPAKCLKELHSPALQEANTHRLFIKLC